MMMDKKRHTFEDFLREFVPRSPRALPDIPASLKVRRMAAGIAVAAVFVGSLWVISRESPRLEAPMSQTSVSARELTRLAMEDPEKFDAALTAASRRLLPRFDGNDSALRVLAKE